jgi:hypothetical protein
MDGKQMITVYSDSMKMQLLAIADYLKKNKMTPFFPDICRLADDQSCITVSIKEDSLTSLDAVSGMGEPTLAQRGTEGSGDVATHKPSHEAPLKKFNDFIKNTDKDH